MGGGGGGVGRQTGRSNNFHRCLSLQLLLLIMLLVAAVLELNEMISMDMLKP